MIENKISTKNAVSQSISSSCSSAVNDVQSQPLQPSLSTAQQPIVPPLVLTQKAAKSDKKSQNAFTVRPKQVTKKKDKDEGRRVTRHSPQNSTVQSSSPSKLLAVNSTNGRTSSSSSIASLSSPNKSTSKSSQQSLPVAHKRSPSSPVPNQFINTNLIRATKSQPTPILKANFLALQKTKTGIITSNSFNSVNIGLLCSHFSKILLLYYNQKQSFQWVFVHSPNLGLNLFNK